MRIEVGCLTRNIVIQGNPEDSTKYKYGGHLMLHGKSNEGAQARLENIEFRYTGQPRIIGRYTVHMHMNGDLKNSYMRGCAVHHAFARVIALHSVQYMTV